jgi:hypothetical protein
MWMKELQINAWSVAHVNEKENVTVTVHSIIYLCFVILCPINKTFLVQSSKIVMMSGRQQLAHCTYQYKEWHYQLPDIRCTCYGVTLWVGCASSGDLSASFSQFMFIDCRQDGTWNILNAIKISWTFKYKRIKTVTLTGLQIKDPWKTVTVLKLLNEHILDCGMHGCCYYQVWLDNRKWFLRKLKI